METNKPSIENKADEVMKHLGALEESVENLEEEDSNCKSTANEVGSWIAAIGKAIMTFIKH